MIENNSITKPSLIHDRLKIMSQVYHNFMIYPESVISCLSSISNFLVVLYTEGLMSYVFPIEVCPYKEKFNKKNYHKWVLTHIYINLLYVLSTFNFSLMTLIFSLVLWTISGPKNGFSQTVSSKYYMITIISKLIKGRYVSQLPWNCTTQVQSISFKIWITLSDCSSICKWKTILKFNLVIIVCCK